MTQFRKPLPPGVEIIPPPRAAGNVYSVPPAAAAEQPDRPAKPWNKILLMAILLALYVISPVDFIPDFIPVLGQLDDVLVGGGLLGLMLRTVLKYYTAKHMLRSPRAWLLSKLLARR